MLQTTLSTALKKLKAVLGYDPSAAADDERLFTLIELTQEWLAGKQDWPQLEDRWTASASSRWTAVPTTDEATNAHAINWDRPVQVHVLEGSTWLPLEKGIDVDEFSVQSSPDGDTQEPPQRWQFKVGDTSYFDALARARDRKNDPLLRSAEANDPS